ncbi:MAG: hypothetical protein ACJAVI_001155 [Candidatus Azotimanducaceae bacterium]|jgi:hypothetical protein
MTNDACDALSGSRMAIDVAHENVLAQVHADCILSPYAKLPMVPWEALTTVACIALNIGLIWA